MDASEALKIFLEGMAGVPLTNRKARVIAQIGMLARVLRDQRVTNRKVTGERDRFLQSTYGLDLATWEQVLLVQGSVCAICRTPDPGKQWHTDHCHKTDRVRGILCSGCNVGLGAFRDDPAALRSAADYLGP